MIMVHSLQWTRTASKYTYHKDTKNLEILIGTPPEAAMWSAHGPDKLPVPDGYTLSLLHGLADERWCCNYLGQSSCLGT